jgi:hypothetical protein
LDYASIIGFFFLLQVMQGSDIDIFEICGADNKNRLSGGAVRKVLMLGFSSASRKYNAFHTLA